MTTEQAETNEAPDESIDAPEAILADMFPGTFDAPEVSPKGAPSGKAGSEKTSGKAQPSRPAKAAPGESEAEESDAESEAAADTSGNARAPDGASALAAVGDDALFNAKALATPAGIAAARQAVIDARAAARDEKSKAHATFVRTQRREATVAARETEANRALAVNQSMHQRLVSDLDVLRNGTAEQVIETLGRITGRSGIEAYEQMTSAIVANGKKPPAAQRDPELLRILQANQAELAQLRASQAQREEQEAQRTWRSEMTRAVQTPDYPGLSEAFKDYGTKLIERMDEITRSYYQESAQIGRVDRNGSPLPLTRNALLAHFENHFAGYRSTRGGETVRTEVAPRAPMQRQAAKPRHLPGKTLSPSRAASEGGTRELTDDERFDELVNEPGIMGRLGLG